MVNDWKIITIINYYSIMISWHTLGLGPGPVYNFVILSLVSLNEENDISSEVSVGLPHNWPIGWDPIIHQLNLCYLIMNQSFTITNLYTFQLQTTLWREKKNVFLLTALWLCNRSPWFSSSWRWRRVAGCLKDPRMNRNIIWRTNFLSSHWFSCLSFSFLSFLFLVCERE